MRHGDNNWGDIIRWSVYRTIAAEELGIDSTNVDSFMGGEDRSFRICSAKPAIWAAMGIATTSATRSSNGSATTADLRP